jgi:hypothetical protein
MSGRLKLLQRSKQSRTVASQRFGACGRSGEVVLAGLGPDLSGASESEARSWHLYCFSSDTPRGGAPETATSLNPDRHLLSWYKYRRIPKREREIHASSFRHEDTQANRETLSKLYRYYRYRRLQVLTTA